MQTANKLIVLRSRSLKANLVLCPPALLTLTATELDTLASNQTKAKHLWCYDKTISPQTKGLQPTLASAGLFRRYLTGGYNVAAGPF